jgi:hypothetical protein
LKGPDFICFGLQKAGTGWLYDQMASCGQIWMPPVKEISYFAGNPYKRTNTKIIERCEAADPGLSGVNGEFVKRFRSGLDRERDLEWYRALFEPKSGRISYVTAPSEVSAACPDAKFIFLIRNPIDRFWSAVSMHLRGGRLDQKQVANWGSVKKLLARPLYVNQSYPSRIWARWSSLVPAGSIRFWCLDDIIADPDRVRREIVGFLGVTQPTFGLPADHNRKQNTKKFVMPSGVRDGLREAFRKEMETSAELFGGAARLWR